MSLGDSYHSVILKKDRKVFSKRYNPGGHNLLSSLPLTDTSLHVLHAQKAQDHTLLFIQFHRILFGMGNYKIRDPYYLLIFDMARSVNLSFLARPDLWPLHSD